MDKITEKILTSTINFWSENSYQHIDVLLNGHGGTGAVLYPTFEKELKMISDSFRTIQASAKENIPKKDLMSLTKKFTTTNNKLIKILERLRFEGFNGYPILFETVYHFTYEQKYANKLVEPMQQHQKQQPISSIFKTTFQQGLMHTTTLKCIYTQMYFWSLIGGQHPSLLITIPGASQALPDSIKMSFKEVTNKFNNINYQLSNTYNDLSKKSLYNIFKEFYMLNNEFLDILKDIKNKKPDLPDIFYGVLEHIIDEHEYIDSLIDDFKMFFAN